ncbi:hypothetical protein DFH08DRAFT_350825, partial [Mycena albidolilacea]
FLPLFHHVLACALLFIRPTQALEPFSGQRSKDATAATWRWPQAGELSSALSPLCFVRLLELPVLPPVRYDLKRRCRSVRAPHMHQVEVCHCSFVRE